jgi:hypothetical protein
MAAYSRRDCRPPAAASRSPAPPPLLGPAPRRPGRAVAGVAVTSPRAGAVTARALVENPEGPMIASAPFTAPAATARR